MVVNLNFAMKKVNKFKEVAQISRKRARRAAYVERALAAWKEFCESV
jgi:hypothetical protein